MKILIYGINFAPELTGIGKYTGEMAAWLAERGHQVSVITAPPYYPQWQVQPGYHASRYQSHTWHNVKVYRVPLWIPAIPSGVKRLLHLASFALSSLPVLCYRALKRPDVIMVIEPPLFCAPAAVAVARLSGARTWLHIQDYEVDAAFELGLLKGKRLKGLVSRLEGWLMQRFDRISTLSTRMLARATQKGVDPIKCIRFPNWIDVTSFNPTGPHTTPFHSTGPDVTPFCATGPNATPFHSTGDGAAPHPSTTAHTTTQNTRDAISASTKNYRAQLGIPETATVAMYAGNLGKKQGLGTLADVAQTLRRRQDIHFIFCGEGPQRAELQQRCQHLKQVHFLPLQPAHQLGALLTSADIHLLPQRAGAADLVMPSKLTGMLASGRPVICGASANTELAEVVKQCGLVVTPESSFAMARALLKLAKDKSRRLALGQAAWHYAQSHFHKETVLRHFEQALEALCTPHQVLSKRSEIS